MVEVSPLFDPGAMQPKHHICLPSMQPCGTLYATNSPLIELHVISVYHLECFLDRSRFPVAIDWLLRSLSTSRIAVVCVISSGCKSSHYVQRDVVRLCRRATSRQIRREPTKVSFATWLLMRARMCFLMTSEASKQRSVMFTPLFHAFESRSSHASASC